MKTNSFDNTIITVLAEKVDNLWDKINKLDFENEELKVENARLKQCLLTYNSVPKKVTKDESYEPLGKQREVSDGNITKCLNNGYEYIDLGLSVKWATCNVGASKPEDYGDYFAWGETGSKETYDYSTYKWCKGSYDTMTKYCTSSSYGTVDNKTTLDLEDDAAHVNWGGNWRMPTEAEQDELRNTNNCTWTWTTQNGVKGYKVTSKKNGNSIFLPAAGYRGDSDLNYAGSYGYYWSSLSRSDSNYAYYLYFSSSGVSWGGDFRYYGRSVRAVCE